MKARFTPTWRSLVMCGLPRPEWSEKVLDDHLAARRSPPRSAGSACGLHRQRHARFGAQPGLQPACRSVLQARHPPNPMVLIMWFYYDVACLCWRIPLSSLETNTSLPGCKGSGHSQTPNSSTSSGTTWALMAAS